MKVLPKSKNSFFHAVSISFAFLLVNAALAAAPGDLVDPPKELKTLIKSVMKITIQNSGIDFTAPDLDPNLANPKYDVNLYKITYWTTGVSDLHLPRNQRTLVKATGMLLLPLRTKGKIPLLSYQHGTSASRKNVPSYSGNLETLMAGALLGANGYAVSAPDYLGLGGSDVFMHPYLHAESEATASADMLLAVEKALVALGKNARNPKVTLSRQLFLAGYSQGAHATMSLHRYLQKEKVLKNFDIVASAPMAGPFDLGGSTISNIMAAPGKNTTFYLTYILLGLNQIYKIYDDNNKTEVFSALAAKDIDYHFANLTPDQDLVPAVPATLEELLNKDFFDALKNNPASHPSVLKMVAGLKENIVYEWVPEAPMKFYHAEDDGDVPYANSQAAYDYMKKAGADVELIPLGKNISHEEAAFIAVPKALTWFEKVKIK